MKFIKAALGYLETFGGVFSALAMIGCFGFGLVQVGVGFLRLCSAPGHSSELFIDSVLRGLELFFLAPLPFLAFCSIIRLLRAWTGVDRTNAQSVQFLEAAREDVGWVKRFITGLMIAVVSTDLIHRIIGDNGPDVRVAAIILGLIAVLSLYYGFSKK
jgi:hypothetical protein